MKKTTFLLLGLILAGCSDSIGGNGIDLPPAEIVKSDKERDTSPSVTEVELSGLVAGNSQFALDLYQIFREEDGNLFYSPYSISIALAMTYAGALGNTQEQMASVLRFTLPQDRLHPAFNALDLELASRGEGAQETDGEGFKLNIVNGIWGQVGYSFLPEFLDLLAENYGAGLWLLDFLNDPEGARLVINDWVSDQTEEKIKDLLPEGAVSNVTRFVLTNAIYFNAAWDFPFQESNTRDGPFQPLEGQEVTVPMMSQTEYFGYAAGDGYRAVELPYEGRELSMVIVLPEEGRFQAFEEGLDALSVDSILSALTPEYLELTMPKFEYESGLSLKKTLVQLGMTDPFLDTADFSGMDGTRTLYLGDIAHQAFVSVNEAGTEAAAATGVVGTTTDSVPPPPIPFTIDRPFLFIIRDIETGTILFLGRVTNPS